MGRKTGLSGGIVDRNSRARMEIKSFEDRGIRIYGTGGSGHAWGGPGGGGGYDEPRSADYPRCSRCGQPSGILYFETGSTVDFTVGLCPACDRKDTATGELIDALEELKVRHYDYIDTLKSSR